MTALRTLARSRAASQGQAGDQRVAAAAHEAGVARVPSAGSAHRTIPWTPVIAVTAVTVWLASAFYMWHFGRTWHLDLRVYRAAGRALLDHGAPFRSSFTAHHLPFTYPPFGLLALTPLSLGPLGLVEGAWWLASSVALVGTLYVLVPSDVAGHALPVARRLAVASLVGGLATLALEPVRSNMDYGQINLLLMWLVVMDLRRSGPKWRGVTVGLAAAVKLTPIVYLLYFAVRRDWRSVAQGVGTFVALSLAAWMVLPSDSLLYWFHEVGEAARTGSVGYVSNQSWCGVLHRWPFSGDSLDAVLWAVFCAVVVAAGVFAAYQLASERRPLVESILVLALVELLISPISWTHHWSWLAVAPFAAFSLWRHRRWTSIAIGATIGVGIAAPYWWGFQGGFGGFFANNALVLSGTAVLMAFGARRPTVGPGRAALTRGNHRPRRPADSAGKMSPNGGLALRSRLERSA